MEIVALIFAALLPAAVLLIYIYRKDKAQPEPTKWLIKGFCFGVISAFASTLISTPLNTMGFYSAEPDTLWGAVREAFFGAAIPEEAAKLLMLWLLLRVNPYFDEKVDGIVYAACIGMGFASIENVMYLMMNFNNWLGVGILRALISVPGHFMFAVTMGYYYSLGYWNMDGASKGGLFGKFGRRSHGKRNWGYIALAFLAPMLLHGIFDALLMMSNLVTTGIAAALFFCFSFFFLKMRRAASRKISRLLAADASASAAIISDPEA